MGAWIWVLFYEGYEGGYPRYQNKKVEKQLKKCFDQLLGVRSTQKLVEIHYSFWTVFLILDVWLGF